MTLLLIQPAELSTWLEHLLAASIKGAFVLFIATALCLLLRRASAASRHLVWSLALAGLVALPVLSFELPAWHIPVLPMPANETGATVSAEPASFAYAAASTLSQSGSSKSAASIAQENRGAAKTESSIEIVPARLQWSQWALIVWLAGALLILARLFAGTLSVSWIRRRASAVADDNWLTLSNEI